MKKIVVIFTVGIILASVSISCSSNPCVTCVGVKVCKDTYSPANGESWESYILNKKAQGCTID